MPYKLNMQNLHRATGIVDKNFDRMLTKYPKNMQEYGKYVSKKEHAMYVRARLEKINTVMRHAPIKTK